MARPIAECQPDHLSRMRFAFPLVRVQQIGRERAVQHSGELPRQVRRIAQTGAHALPDERGSEVGGIAEQEDVSTAPAVGDLRPERVLGDAQQIQSVVADAGGPRLDQDRSAAKVPKSCGSLVRRAVEIPTGSGSRRCACRSRRAPDRRPGVRPPTGADRRRWRRRPPASAARISDPAWSNRSGRAPRCWRRRSPARSRPSTVCVRPSHRSVNVDPHAAARISVSAVTSASPRNSTRAYRARLTRSSASNSGWSNMLACGNPCTLRALSRWNSASTR